MKTSELLKLFKENGIILNRYGKKHDLYFSPITYKIFPVPRHKTEITRGTLQNILKDAGLK